MKTVTDGGPAFPFQVKPPLYSIEYGQKEVLLETGMSPGMSLRAWFAGKAMQGFLASKTFSHLDETEALASASCRRADALIAELNKTE